MWKLILLTLFAGIMADVAEITISTTNTCPGDNQNKKNGAAVDGLYKMQFCIMCGNYALNSEAYTENAWRIDKKICSEFVNPSYFSSLSGGTVKLTTDFEINGMDCDWYLIVVSKSQKYDNPAEFWPWDKKLNEKGMEGLKETVKNPFLDYPLFVRHVEFNVNRVRIVGVNLSPMDCSNNPGRWIFQQGLYSPYIEEIGPVYYDPRKLHEGDFVQLFE